jgi:hypothetical protein
LIWWEILNLDISTYMLRKFLYWDWSYEYYWNNHWISEKVKKWDFYKNEINNVIKSQSIKTEWIYYNSWTWDIWDWLMTDFPTSFWTVNWEMTWKINENWQIETNFLIKDTYIFNYFHSDWVTIITNPANVIAKYYQDEWYWTPFNWELSITKILNY